jgi:hypothetical protein
MIVLIIVAVDGKEDVSSGIERIRVVSHRAFMFVFSDVILPSLKSSVILHLQFRRVRWQARL